MPQLPLNEVPSYSEPSLQSRDLMEKGQRYFMPNYKPRDVVFDRGEGARLWDTDGNEYIDMGTGISVTSLGHQEPDLVKAFLAQGKRLWHTSNLYWNEPAVRLAEELVQSAPFANKVFFCNSGAEANEAAIKLARKHSSLHYPAQKREIITFYGGFHGRTLAAVTATAQPKYQEGFEPVPGGFVYCDYNDIAAVDKLVSEKTCAILVEPIQGEGGVNPAQPGFLSHLRKLCDQHDALLMCDEVQTGMGRSGKLYTYEWEDGLVPDVVTMAKALGGGLPIGAMLVGEKAQQALDFGSHGSTFGGNAVASAVARVMLDKIRQPEFLAHVTRQGDTIVKTLQELTGELNMFSEIRGKGLMIGAELKDNWRGRAGDLSARCQQHGVLVLIAGADVLRFLPPLNISDEELQTGLARFASTLREAAQQ